eukprot:9157404-Pyramimonas_sp.AAC.2
MEGEQMVTLNDVDAPVCTPPCMFVTSRPLRSTSLSPLVSSRSDAVERSPRARQIRGAPTLRTDPLKGRNTWTTKLSRGHCSRRRSRT